MLKSCAVKAPGFGGRLKAMLHDTAILTGGELVSEELGLKLENASLDQLGHAKRIVIGKDTTTVTAVAAKVMRSAPVSSKSGARSIRQ